MAKNQINIRISTEGRKILKRLVNHFSRQQTETGRKATQAEILERALRSLAAREQVR